MPLLIAAFIAFIVAYITASALLKMQQSADTRRIALLEQRVEELTRRLGHAPAPLAASSHSPNLAPTSFGDPAAGASGLSSTVAALLAQNRKIEAIKIFRDQTGVGLKEAKDAVEEIERQGF